MLGRWGSSEGERTWDVLPGEFRDGVRGRTSIGTRDQEGSCGDSGESRSC